MENIEDDLYLNEGYLSCTTNIKVHNRKVCDKDNNKVLVVCKNKADNDVDDTSGIVSCLDYYGSSMMDRNYEGNFYVLVDL